MYSITSFVTTVLVHAASVSGTDVKIIRSSGPGCTAPRAICFNATPGNCCRAPLPGMFPMRGKGVSIFLDQNTQRSASVPYKRGNGKYCGDPITSEATFGDISCYQNPLLGSGLYVNCVRSSAKFGAPPNATEVFERSNSLCPNGRRDESDELSSNNTSSGRPNIATGFTDEYGKPTDERR